MNSLLFAAPSRCFILVRICLQLFIYRSASGTFLEVYLFLFPHFKLIFSSMSNLRYLANMGSLCSVLLCFRLTEHFSKFRKNCLVARESFSASSHSGAQPRELDRLDSTTSTSIGCCDAKIKPRVLHSLIRSGSARFHIL